MVNIMKSNKDEWGGFADLLANLIEKYADDLDIENLPGPQETLEKKDQKESINPLNCEKIHDNIDMK